MVCVPCVLIPVLLVLYKFFEPLLIRLKNLFWKPGPENKPENGEPGECFGLFSSCPCMLTKKKPLIDSSENVSATELVGSEDKKNE